jgi:hypothetical protein
MRKQHAAACLALLVSLLGGCVLDGTAEWALTDISGWNLSACWSGFGTCRELFMDNQERILGGQTAIDAVLGSAGQQP